MKRLNKIYWPIVLPIILASMLSSGMTLAAEQDRAVALSLNIDAQSMTAALNELSVQSGIQFIFPTHEVTTDLQAPSLVGAYTISAALDRLLAHSGLTYTYVNDRTVAIRTSSKVETSSSSPQALADPAEGLKLAQSSPPPAVSGEPPPKSETDSKSSTIQEIVVTAQKRTERLQDVPISISVLSGAQLDKSTATGVADALAQVPGVAITWGGVNDPQISIRGVAAPGALFFGASPVAYYLDSVPFGFVKTALTPDASAYDMDRVEVLRGPQSTLYGATAQNGVVRVLTKDANLDTLEFKARTGVSSTRYGGENYRGDMAVNVPIVAGKLAVRGVVGYQDLSGWVDTPRKENSNDEKRLNLRLKVNAQPLDKLSLGLSGWFSRSDFGGPPQSNDNQRLGTPVDESGDANYDAFGFKAVYEFSSFSFTSSTSYLDYSIFFPADNALFNGSNILFTDLDANLFAEEINLSSTLNGVWRWSLGGMYRDAEDTTWQIRRNSAGALAGGYVTPTDFTNSSESFALFGELTRLFVDGRLELTGGLRYFEDKTALSERSRSTGVPVQAVSPNGKFDSVSPRVLLTWHANTNMTAYASYSEGFRSGADQTPAVVAAAPALGPAKPDKLKNYELGMKGSVLSGGLAFDAALYRMDWQDVQTPLLVNVGGNNFAGLVNGVSASGMGFDLGLTARPAAGLTLGLSFSVNDLEQDEAIFSGGALLFAKDDRLNLSPKYTAGSTADYVFPLSAGGMDGRISASANYVSKREQRSFSSTSLTIDSKPLLMGQASFSIESPNGWAAMLFADNITNEKNPVVSVGVGVPVDRSIRLRPRTIGVQLDYQFGR